VTRGLFLLALGFLGGCGGRLSERASCGPGTVSSGCAPAGVVDLDAGATNEPPVDASGVTDSGPSAEVVDAQGFDAAGLDASEAALCLTGGNVFAFEGHGGYPGTSGIQIIEGAEPVWSVQSSALGFVQVNALTDGGDPERDPQWGFTAVSSETTTLTPGTTYVSVGDDHFPPFAQVEINGVSCSSVPTGTFTIGEFSSSGSTGSNATLLAWFDLACPDSGTVRGCVSYGR
jgi:hypothetical protein